MWTRVFHSSRQSNSGGRRGRSRSLIVSTERGHGGIRRRNFVAGSAAVDVSSQLLKCVMRTHKSLLFESSAVGRPISCERCFPLGLFFPLFSLRAFPIELTRGCFPDGLCR